MCWQCKAFANQDVPEVGFDPGGWALVASLLMCGVQVTEGRLDEAISTVRDQCLSKYRECKNHNEALQNKINKLQQEKDQVKVGLNSFGQDLQMFKEG